MATGTTEFIDVTTADVFLPEVWHNVLIPSREQALVASVIADRRYEAGMLHKGDLIHVRSKGLLAARTKTANTAITYETITETNTNITINIDEYTAIAVESIVDVQADRNQLEMMAGDLGYGLGLAVDDYMAGLIDDATNTTGALAVESSYDDYLRAIQYLADANAPASERFFYVAPAEASGLMKKDVFMHNDYSMLHGDGPRTSDLEHAYVSSFLNIPIYQSTNVEGSNAAGHDNGLVHRHYMALVMQLKPKLSSMNDTDYLAQKVAVENIYGARVMRNDHGVFMRGA